jgi:IrrE N-terminal-like domain
MTQRWTQSQMKDVATEERAGLGLGPLDPLSPYALAREHGIPVYPIDELSDGTCPPEAISHFTITRPEVWSAALVPAGPGRFILENTAHSRCRRCSSLAHELSHHLLEHPFDNVLLTDENGCRFDKTREKEANFLAAELLVPYQAALKAAFAEKTNDDIAATYGVSTQFAQMRMAGARKHAAYALARQARTRQTW